MVIKMAWHRSENRQECWEFPMGEGQSLQQGHWEDWVATYKIIKLGPCLTLYTKINSKHLKRRPAPLNHLEGKHGESFMIIRLCNDFWIWHQNTSNKSKSRQGGLCHTNQLLHSKGNNQQNQKAIYRMGENIGKLRIWWGLISKMYKELL